MLSSTNDKEQNKLYFSPKYQVRVITHTQST